MKPLITMMTALRTRLRGGILHLVALLCALGLLLAFAPRAGATSSALAELAEVPSWDAAHGDNQHAASRDNHHDNHRDNHHNNRHDNRHDDGDRHRSEHDGHDRNDRTHELPGISLADLVGGEQSFSSKNGQIQFDDFTATVRGNAPTDLDLYRVLPLGDGFRLLTPLFGIFGSDAKLDLGYSAHTNANEFLIDSVSISFMGVAFGAKNRTTMHVTDSDGNRLLARDLAIWQKGSAWEDDHGHYHDYYYDHDHGDRDEHYAEQPVCGDHGDGGRRHDHETLEEQVARLLIEEQIGVRTGLFAATWAVNHHFHTEPMSAVPEPATATLLGLGLLGLCTARRRPGAPRT